MPGTNFVSAIRFVLVLAVLLATGACRGEDGTNGTDGKDGTSCTVHDNGDGTATISCADGTTATVANGTDGASCVVTDNGNGTRTITCGDGTSVVVLDGVVDFAVMTPDEIKQANLSAAIVDLSIPADGRPVVKIKVSERHGMGVKHLAPGPISWRFALLKLTDNVNGSANETWVSYLANNSTSTAGTETATTAGLTDNNDGTYTYRFTKVITGGLSAAGTTFEPNRPHRFVMLLSASGNPFSAINLVRDFVPDSGTDITGQHDKVDPGACLECHTQFRGLPGATGELGTGEFHSGSRWDVRTCVACHNDQRRFTTLSSTTVGDAAIGADGTWTGNLAVLNGEANINFPVFIHKIHMGEELAMKGGTYSGLPQPYEVTYPQDVRNCAKCHRNAPLADNWKLSPSRRACGACHDNVSFADVTPPGRVRHTGGAFADDSVCTVCHKPGGLVDPVASHRPVSLPNANNIYANPAGTSNTNAAWVAATGYVPPGAKALSYEVQSVGLDATRHPQIAFRIMSADPNANPPVPPAPVTFPAQGAATELIANFVGSPSAYFVFAIPQDGITAPADYNMSASGYIRNIWNGTATGSGAGTLTGPDGSGFYTVTLTGVTVPTTATMLTGGIGYTYSLGSAPTFSNNTLPFTQIDLVPYPYTPNASGFGGRGGLIVPAPDVWKVATGFTGRRTVVANSKCAACHVTLGVGPDFHAGQRNDAPTCSFCHRPNQTSSAWSANVKDFIHGIHGAEKRTVPFNWHAPSATEGYYNITYPGVLNKCDMCHLPGTYDFSTTSMVSALPNMLMSTVGQGRYNSSPTTNPTGYFSISPFVVSNNTVDYGLGFATSNNTATLPDGISGTQTIGGNTVACTPASPCTCNATNPCSVDVNGQVVVSGITVDFTQKIGTTTNACNAVTPCTCTTALPCTATVRVCSPTAPCNAQGTTLVSSPIAAACVACHDTAAAVDHMQTNGASLWEPRSIALTKPQKESCLICHGPNRIGDISLVHAVKAP